MAKSAKVAFVDERRRADAKDARSGENKNDGDRAEAEAHPRSDISYHFHSGLNRGVYGSLAPQVLGRVMILFDHRFGANRWSNAAKARCVD